MTHLPEPSSVVALGSGLPSLDPAQHATLYVVIAGLCLLLALKLLTSAVAPIGPLVRAISAAVLAALVVGAALVMLAFAIFGGGVS